MQVAEQKLANAKTTVVIFWPWVKFERNIFPLMARRAWLQY